MMVLITLYIILSMMGLGIFIVASEGNVDWEEFFNPFRIHKENKVNWFGALFLATISFIFITPVALIFYIYKLCTIGRR